MVDDVGGGSGTNSTTGSELSPTPRATLCNHCESDNRITGQATMRQIATVDGPVESRTNKILFGRLNVSGVFRWATCHMCNMVTYTVNAKVDGTGFDVEIAGIGAHQTTLGFPTEAAANAWIAQDQRRTCADDFFGSPTIPGCRGGPDRA
jgi:hypothetical protein